MDRPLDIAQDGGLFPREELLEAVAGADWRDAPVRLGAWIVLALGAALVAAGFPELHALLMGPTTFAAEQGGHLSAPLHAVARWAGNAGIGIEASLFMISAASLGAALLCIGASLRSFGFAGRLSLLISLAAALSLPILGHARFPATYVPGVCMAALLLAAIAAPSDGRGRGYGLRIAMAWSLASWIHPGNLWTLPACALALWSRGRGRAGIADLAPLAVAASAAVGLMALSGVDSILGPAHESAFPWTWRVFGMTGLFAVAGRLTRRAPEETGAPAWLLLWTWTGIGLELMGWSSLGPGPAVFLAPALATFAANAIARRTRASDGALLILLAFAGQAIPLVTWHALDPDDGSALHVSAGELMPKDVVLLNGDSDAPLRYLLERRHGVAVVDPLQQGAVDSVLKAQRIVSVALAHPVVTHVLDVQSGEVKPVHVR